MRNLKKMLGNELLQLALMLSLLRVDPDSWLSSRAGHDNYDTSDLINNGSDVWTQTQFGDSMNFGGIGGDMSPRLHPKSMDSLLDRFQNEILEDLNSLGRYNRISLYQGMPVEISAYVVNTPEPVPNGSGSGSSGGGENRPETDSDSGISDTEVTPSNFGSDSESDKEEDRASPEALEEELPILEFQEAILPEANLGEEIKTEESMEDEDLERLINPHDILEGPLGPAFLPDPEDLENQLFQIDDQLITIDENLDEISDEFLHLDEQLAAHIDEEEDNAAYLEDLLDVSIPEPASSSGNPFDVWQMDAHRGLDEFFHLDEDLFTESEKEKEAAAAAATTTTPEVSGTVAASNDNEEVQDVKIKQEEDAEAMFVPVDIPDNILDVSLPFDLDFDLVSF